MSAALGLRIECTRLLKLLCLPVCGLECSRTGAPPPPEFSTADRKRICRAPPCRKSCLGRAIAWECPERPRTKRAKWGNVVIMEPRYRTRRADGRFPAVCALGPVGPAPPTPRFNVVGACAEKGSEMCCRTSEKRPAEAPSRPDFIPSAAFGDSFTTLNRGAGGDEYHYDSRRTDPLR